MIDSTLIQFNKHPVYITSNSRHAEHLLQMKMKFVRHYRRYKYRKLVHKTAILVMEEKSVHFGTYDLKVQFETLESFRLT